MYVVQQSSDDMGMLVVLKNDNHEPVCEIVMAQIIIKLDGIWINGFEDGASREEDFPSYYQVLALLPEPNEFSQESV